MTALLNMVSDTIQPTGNLSLILATLWIINNDFAKYTRSSITMGQYAINRQSGLYQNDLVNEVFFRAMIKPEIKFFIEGEETEVVDEELLDPDELEEEFMRKYANREKSIWFLDSFTSYRNFENDLLNPNRHYHRNGYFIFVYTGTERNRLANIKEMFRRLFDLYVTNVNVLLMVGKIPYLYTYFPFAKNKCHSSIPEFFISFRGIENNFSNFVVSKQLFPSKVKNMHGCELVVATWYYPPYIYVDFDPKTGDLLRLHGIEGMLITLLSELMNFKILIKEPVPRDRGDVYPNGTSTGAAKMIIDMEANITVISLMYNKLRSEAMQPSSSYITIPYVLAIPHGRTMTSFERLLKPFHYIIWSCFSSSLLFAIIFLYYLKFLGKRKLSNFINGQRNRIPITNLLSTLFGGPIHNNLPYRTFARYILVVWILYTFVLRSGYSAELFKLLQDGRPRATLSSLSEVVQKNYTIYAFPAVETILKIAMPNVNTDSIGGENSVHNIYERVSSSSYDDRIALCLLEYSIRSYNQMNPKRRVDILAEPLVSAPIVFYMPRHSFLKQRTSDLILGIVSAGLMRRFESSYLYTNLRSGQGHGEPIKLSFWLLFGIFSIYVLFLSFSLAIFLMEVGSLKSSCCKIIIDFLNY